MNIRILLTVFCAFLASFVAQAADEPPILKANVTTIVDRHDGGVGGVVVDKLGYVYVADFLESVWRLNPVDGHIEAYAAGLYGASGNAFDKNGNLFQANYYGNSVVSISRSGALTTVASDDLDGPVGMVFDDDGNLLICSCNDQSIKKLSPAGKVSTFATSDSFSCPNGITRDDDGNVFVVSFSGSKIIKITDEGESSVFADSGGNGIGHIVFLRGVFYATSYLDNKIYRVLPNGKLSLFAGTGERADKDGPVSDAAFSNPNGIAADPTGSFLYINDYIGSESASGVAGVPFSIRRIELPRLHKIIEHKLQTESPEAAEIAYGIYKSDPDNEGEITENEINSLGWTYLLKNDYENAIFSFELNTNSYPDSWTAFSSLGAAYMRAGDSDLAIDALEKSIELNPENTRTIARLEELRDD